jgi:hypothetical protein
MSARAIRIQSLLQVMLKSYANKEEIIELFYNPILENLETLKFITPDNLKEYDLVYKNFIKAVLKNYLYEQSEENKKSILDLISFLDTFEIVSE